MKLSFIYNASPLISWTVFLADSILSDTLFPNSFTSDFRSLPYWTALSLTSLPNSTALSLVSNNFLVILEILSSASAIRLSASSKESELPYIAL